MVNSIDSALSFIFANWYFFVIIGVILAVVSVLLGKRKSNLKPVSRAKVESERFRERMKFNKSPYKYLFRGNTAIGKIESVIAYSFNPEIDQKKKKKNQKEEENGEPEKMVSIVAMIVTPLISSTFRIPIPFHKGDCIQLAWDKVSIRPDGMGLEIAPDLYLDYHMGIYYDKGNESIHAPRIKNDNMIRTDFDVLSSIYYVKSQEQATFNPVNAHDLALKEKEIQLEQSKRTTKLTQV